MSKPPAFQLYAQDFLVGVADMTPEEVGGYIRLLCYQWSKGELPDNDGKLAVLSGISGESLANVRQKFSKTEAGGLANARLVEVGTKREKFVGAKSTAGRKGGMVRAERMAAARCLGDHTRNEWLEMRDFFACCVKCGSTGSIEKDHIVPLAEGGSNAISNIQPLCTVCNAAKGTDRTDYRPSKIQAKGKQAPGKWLAVTQAKGEANGEPSVFSLQ